MPCAVTADGIWLCGPKVQQCAWCGRAADYCCDFPVGEGRTCDLPLCAQHRMLQWEPQTVEEPAGPFRVLRVSGPLRSSIDYCPQHALAGAQHD